MLVIGVIVHEKIFGLPFYTGFWPISPDLKVDWHSPSFLSPSHF
jgi:hypothetical protein